jgi:hypothetical protein
MKDSCKHESAPGALLPDQEHLVLLFVVDPEFGHGVRGFRDNLAVTALAKASGVSEELFLEILCDPLFDDDEVGIVL